MIKPSFERWQAGKAYINLKLVEWGERNKTEEMPITERALQEAEDLYLDRRMPSPLIVPLARACSKVFYVVALLACGTCSLDSLVGTAVYVIGGKESPLIPFFGVTLIASMFTALLMQFMAVLADEVPFFLFMSDKEAAACWDARTGKHGQREKEAQERARAVKRQRILEKDRAVLDAFEKRKG